MKKFSLSTWRPTRKTFHTKQSFREFLKLIFLSFSKDLAYDTWKVKAGGITLYHFSGLVFKFNFSFHKIFLSNIGKWTDFTRNWYLGQNFWTKVKISFLAKVSNLLKFFRKSTCSSDKFPDLAFGPSNYLPNISHRQFSFRIVIKNLISFAQQAAAWDSQKPGHAPNYLPVDSQIDPECSKQARTDISQPMFRACLLPGQTLDGHRKRFSTIIIGPVRNHTKC